MDNKFEHLILVALAFVVFSVGILVLAAAYKTVVESGQTTITSTEIK